MAVPMPHMRASNWTLLSSSQKVTCSKASWHEDDVMVLCVCKTHVVVEWSAGA
jgi:hypothetical protein